MPKVELQDIEYVYLIGIGGIGMSALARYFNANKKVVAGYDKTPTSLTKELEDEGIAIHYEDNIKCVSEELIHASKTTPNKVLVIYTPAIPKDHSELNYFKDNISNTHKRAAVLGEITNTRFTIAVAGTHGKTTISTLIAHILTASKKNCTAFLGGISQNYHTNFISGNKENSKTYIVVEADEYDRSFLNLNPSISIVSSVDADHLDIYGNDTEMRSSYADFCANTNKNNGKLILKKGIAQDLGLKYDHINYSLIDTSDFHASNISIIDGNYKFTINHPNGKIADIKAGLPGRHNLENTVAAAAVCLTLGIPENDIASAISSFKGVKRRFEYHIKDSVNIYIDDYAHHPNELKACIGSIKEMYPNKKITGIFQPHLFSRTKDFAKEFGESLSLLNKVLLLDIYPARELPMEGISSNTILQHITIPEKKIIQKEEVVQWVKTNKPEVLITLGAGDIDQLVAPIKTALEDIRN